MYTPEEPVAMRWQVSGVEGRVHRPEVGLAPHDGPGRPGRGRRTHLPDEDDPVAGIKKLEHAITVGAGDGNGGLHRANCERNTNLLHSSPCRG